MEYITLYNTARSGATRVWKIAVDGNRIITEFGQLDGVMQEVVDYGYAKNEGKKNYISAEDDALNVAERMITKKRREGYSENLHENVEFYPFENGLPERLSFYKPQNSLNEKMERALLRREAWAVRKYDGEMMVLVKDLKGEVSIYSRKMLKTHHQEDIPWAERFPEIVAQTSEIPPGTILLGEMTGDRDADNRWLVAQVMKSLTPRALSLQEEHGHLIYRVWDVAWWNGAQMIGVMQYRYRFDVALLLCAETTKLLCADALIEGEYESIDHLRSIAEQQGWEGFVVVDPCSDYGDKAYNLRGKPERPAACCKLKPYFEDDFVAMWDPAKKVGKYGRGKYTGYLGAVELYQFNSAGELVYICDCGNGFTAEFIEKNSDVDLWPKVIQVRYESRTYMSEEDDTNALQFPRFISERDDKTAEECVNPRL